MSAECCAFREQPRLKIGDEENVDQSLAKGHDVRCSNTPHELTSCQTHSLIQIHCHFSHCCALLLSQRKPDQHRMLPGGLTKGGFQAQGCSVVRRGSGALSQETLFQRPPPPPPPHLPPTRKAHPAHTPARARAYTQDDGIFCPLALRWGLVAVDSPLGLGTGQSGSSASWWGREGSPHPRACSCMRPPAQPNPTPPAAQKPFSAPPRALTRTVVERR